MSFNLSKLPMVFVICLILFISVNSYAQDYNIGVYYFPGWESKSEYWNDLKGLPGSRSPDEAWPEREPLRGYNYPEESVQVAAQNIEWASSYGISYFAYDWYWNGSQTYLNHAIDAYLKAENNSKLKFCLLWSNHDSIPRSSKEFETMIDFWISNYFKHPQHLQIDGKPVVFVFSPARLEENAKKFNMTSKELIAIAKKKALAAGLRGIYFVGSSGAYANYVNKLIPDSGYDSISTYNYQSKSFQNVYDEKTPEATNYLELLEGYKSHWNWIITQSKLPYIIPMTAGWHRGPWGSKTPHDNCVSTPETFKRMLTEAKLVMDKYPAKTKKTGIICAWNELGEGSYIEPTKKYRFKYLEMIKQVFQ